MSQKRDKLGKLVNDLQAGLGTFLPSGVKSLKVGDTVFSIQKLAKTLKGYDDLWRIAEELVADFHAAVQTRKAKVHDVREFVIELKYAIVAALGSRNPDLLKFGIQPRKDRKKLTGEERARAAAKARASRRERTPVPTFAVEPQKKESA